VKADGFDQILKLNRMYPVQSRQYHNALHQGKLTGEENESKMVA